MQAVFGVIFHFIGGFASASFYVPFKKVVGWAWESYWIIGGIFSWIIVPFIAAYVTVPGFMDIISNADSSVIFWTYFLGALWGIGGLTFGLAVRYLGISLGQSVALGFCSAFGALMPPVYYDLFTEEASGTFSSMLSSTGGKLVIAGVLVCILGIYICGKAGMMKEEELSDEQKKVSVKDFDLKKGLAVAIISGILSACFNYGIVAGHPMADMAVEMGSNPLFQNNVTFILIMLGGFTTNFIWCMYLNTRNKTFSDYSNKKTPLLKNYLFSALAGATWYMQFFFYGMGEIKLGSGASSWILHMAFIIILSNIWGIALKEWKGVRKKTFTTLIAGIAVIILSVVMVGYGNAI